MLGLTHIHIRSGRSAFDRITGYIKKAKDAGGEVLVGGIGMSPSICVVEDGTQCCLQGTIQKASSCSLLSSSRRIPSL